MTRRPIIGPPGHVAIASHVERLLDTHSTDPRSRLVRHGSTAAIGVSGPRAPDLAAVGRVAPPRATIT